MTPLLLYWQRQLRLEDWDVHVDVVPAYQLGGDLGRCEVQHNTRRARIRIADPATIEGDPNPSVGDMEATLVHELLHVAFPGDLSDGSTSTAGEQATEATAQALVRLNRGLRR